MDDQADAKPKSKRRPPSRLGKGPTPTSWKPGQSGNPHGRVKHVLAFAERVRERVDPDLVIELALAVAEDVKLPAVERLAALWPLVDRGWTKPPNMSAIHLTTVGEHVERDWRAMPLDERRMMLAKIKALPAAQSSREVSAPPADQGLDEPMVTVEKP